MMPIASLLRAAEKPADRETTPRVLVVDDNSAVCELLSLVLGQKGLEVACARTAGEGKVLMERGEFDLVILDWKLDGVDGLDLLRLSKAHHPEIPIIIFTGADVSQALRESGPMDQADAVVRKSGPLDALCKAVLDLLGLPEIERVNAA